MHDLCVAVMSNCRTRNVTLLQCRQLVQLMWLHLHLTRYCHVTTLGLLVYRRWTMQKQMLTVGQVLARSTRSVCHWGLIPASAVYMMRLKTAMMQKISWMMLLDRLLHCHHLKISSLWWRCMVRFLLYILCQCKCLYVLRVTANSIMFDRLQKVICH